MPERELLLRVVHRVRSRVQETRHPAASLAKSDQMSNRLGPERTFVGARTAFTLTPSTEPLVDYVEKSPNSRSNATSSANYLLVTVSPVNARPRAPMSFPVDDHQRAPSTPDDPYFSSSDDSEAPCSISADEQARGIASTSHRVTVSLNAYFLPPHPQLPPKPSPDKVPKILRVDLSEIHFSLLSMFSSVLPRVFLSFFEKNFSVPFSRFYPPLTPVLYLFEFFPRLLFFFFVLDVT